MNNLLEQVLKKIKEQNKEKSDSLNTEKRPEETNKSQSKKEHDCVQPGVLEAVDVNKVKVMLSNCSYGNISIWSQRIDLMYTYTVEKQISSHKKLF
ncbi:hypothetical protein BIY23_01745 [Wolbachia pipientis]|uniref:Uncharacterized protein n=1 Tax=Wolbachia pipientis TaxID=955 RepID=A0A1E7QL90_WOLPI|nr:hypothetical protein [Wolbachia pipientis]OEY87177.1 hypothetical protein BIY23_01745 [Wolbachia pipientis]